MPRDILKVKNVTASPFFMCGSLERISLISCQLFSMHSFSSFIKFLVIVHVFKAFSLENPSNKLMSFLPFMRNAN